jgi:hypothetical protein
MIRLKKLLLEQKPENLMPFQPDNPAFTGKVKARQTAADLVKGAEASAKAIALTKHEMLDVAEIVTAFIPVVGPILSGAIGVAHAAMYFAEDDPYTGGLYLTFAALPGGAQLMKQAAGKLGIKAWLSGFAKKLKLSSGGVSKPIKASKAEKELVVRASANKGRLKKIAATAKSKGKLAVKTGAKAVAANLKDIAVGFVAINLYDLAYYQAASITPQEFETALDRAEQEELSKLLAKLDIQKSKTESVNSLQEQLSTQKNKKTDKTGESGSWLSGLTSMIPDVDMKNAMYLIGGIAAIRWLRGGGTGQKSNILVRGLGKGTKWTFRTLLDLLKVTFTAGKRGTKGLKTQFGAIITKQELDVLIQTFRQERQKQYKDVVANIEKGTYTAQEALDSLKKQTVFKKNLKRYESSIESAFAEIETKAKSTKGDKVKSAAASDYTRSGSIGFQQRSAKMKAKRGGKEVELTLKNMTQDEYNKLSPMDKMWLDSEKFPERLNATYDEARTHTLKNK